MKNINTIINIVLGLAVATLFYLHFNNNSSSTETSDHNDTTKVAILKPKIANNTLLKEAKVVYINIDSLNTLCLYYSEMNKIFKNKQKKFDESYSNQLRGWEAQAMEYQQKINSMTDEDLQKADLTMRQKRSQIEESAAKQEQKLKEELYKSNEILNKKIKGYLEKYAKEKGYKYVLGYGSGSNLLYANDSLDVSFDVINGLNKQYKANK
jgi:outer membrane protein